MKGHKTSSNGYLNKQLDQFRFNVRPTQVQGTRCAELALFVCLESPVINVADHPSHYKGVIRVGLGLAWWHLPGTVLGLFAGFHLSRKSCLDFLLGPPR
jgi:hypothetical protein